MVPEGWWNTNEGLNAHHVVSALAHHAVHCLRGV